MKAWQTLLRAEWDRILGWCLVGTGVLLVGLAFRGVADSPFVSDQLAYIVSGGIGGVLAAVVGGVLLISADLHDEWRKLDRIEAAIRSGGVPEADPFASSTRDAAGNGNQLAASASGAGRAPAPLPSPVAGPVLASTIGGESRRQTLLLSGGLVLGATALGTIGWRQAAGTPEFEIAVRGVATAMVGLILLGFALAGLLLRHRSRLARRESALLGGWYLTALVTDRRSRAVDDSGPATEPASAEVMVGEGLGRYHRPGCPALAGVAVRPVPPGATLDRPLRPCGICDARRALGGAGAEGAE